MDLSNCLSLFSIAEAYGSAALLHSAEGFMIENFHDLSETQDFLEMQVTPVAPEKTHFPQQGASCEMYHVKSQVNVFETCLRSDALNVPSEEEVVESLLRWIHHDLRTRHKLLPGLLSLTRLHHLPALEVWTHTHTHMELLAI